MIAIILMIFGFGSSNAQKPTIQELKAIAVENAVNGNTYLLDCIDRNSRKGELFILQSCKVK